MSYNFNFSDLSRFMDDFTYLIQKGGRFNKILSTNSKNTIELIIYWVVLIIKLVLIIVAIYVIYMILFKGYPRLFVNVLMFKFSNKENLDGFLKEHDLIPKAMKELNNRGSVELYKKIYGSTNVLFHLQLFEEWKDKYYFKYQYNEKYFYAFKEFYLFFNKLEIITPTEVSHEMNKIKIDRPEFYEQLITYRKQLNELDTTNKGEDQILYEVYMREQAKSNDYKAEVALEAIKRNLVEIGKELQNIITESMKLPIIPYIALPDDNTTNQLQNNIQDIISGKIYDAPRSQLHDLTWIFVEYLSYNKNQYDYLSAQLPKYSSQEYNKIIYYLTLPGDKKAVAESRLMENNIKLFDFVKKHPIFAQIYFSNNIISKANTYYAVMNAYSNLSNNNKTDIVKLVNDIRKNGKLFKGFLLNVSIMHLFINVYQPNLTKMYEKQIISTKRFFIELWTPFFNDIVVNRLKNRFKKTFSISSVKTSYKQFKIKWDMLGDTLKKMIVAVFKAFFTSVPIEKPQEANTDDGQNINNTN